MPINQKNKQMHIIIYFIQLKIIKNMIADIIYRLQRQHPTYNYKLENIIKQPEDNLMQVLLADSSSSACSSQLQSQAQSQLTSGKQNFHNNIRGSQNFENIAQKCQILNRYKNPFPMPFMLIVLVFCLVPICDSSLNSLSVSISGSQTINAMSTHTWNITFSNTASRSQFTLFFPNCVTLSASSTVTMSTPTTATTLAVTSAFPTSSLNFTLSPAISAANYIFSVSNVKNCYYSDDFSTFTVFNDVDGNLSRSAVNFVKYTPGSLANCEFRFDGYTGDTGKTVSIGFKIGNSVVGSSFRVRVQYPLYSGGTLDIATGNTIICQLQANSTVISTSSPQVNTLLSTIQCPFSQSTVISPSDTLVLKLNNITNPITENYYTQSDFILTTLDGNLKRYETTSACSMLDVPLRQENGVIAVTGNQFISGDMYPLRVDSANSIPIRLARNDKIIIKYTSGEAQGCSTVEVDKTGGTSVTFNRQTNSANRTLQYLLSSTIPGLTTNKPISLSFQNCIMKMPPSTFPIQFTLTFSALISASNGLYANYMQINAQLFPIQRTMSISANEVTMGVSLKTIGDLGTYTFGWKIKYQLSSLPYFTIQFPQQIDVSTAVATLASCSITINNTGIGTKTCSYISPSTLKFQPVLQSSLPPDTSISVTVPNIRNPQNPIPLGVFAFNIATYYTVSQPTGMVEKGLDVVKPLPTYEARIVYPYVVGSGFVVYTKQPITISYTNGVKLNAGTIIQISFITGTDLIDQVTFLSSSGPLSQISNSFRFTITSPLQSLQTLQLTFQCLTPPKTGVYSLASITTTYNSNQYQKTSSPITVQITVPKINAFTITIPTERAITGLLANYSIIFGTDVPHYGAANGDVVLEILFPAGTEVNNGVTQCISGCKNKTVFDTTSGSQDRIQVYPTCWPTPATSPCYNFQLTLSFLKNQREVSTSPVFTFRTMTTQNRQLILTGTGTVPISKANTLTAIFKQSDDYYRDNNNLVHIQLNVTNRLNAGDYFVIQFNTDKTYRLNGGNVTCDQGACTTQQVGIYLHLKVVLTASQALSTFVSLEIFGLISDSDTLFSQSIPIKVASYSGTSGNMIDEGTLYYSIDCSNNCKTCINSSLSSPCTSCYNPPDYLMPSSSICTNNCGSQSQYETFPNSSICQQCIPPCYSCLNATFCRKCISSFYLLEDGNGTCQMGCNASAGLYIVVEAGFGYCRKCSEAGCLSCPADRCDYCDKGYILDGIDCINGSCQPGFYNFNSKCVRCDASCKFCNAAGNNGCIQCATNFYNNTGLCLNKCPDGTVIIGTICSCTAPCATCQSNPNNCLSCIDPTNFLYKSVCMPYCPQKTYSVGKQCFDCQSGCLACSLTTCMACTDGFSIFENQCLSDCKVKGERYTSMTISQNGITAKKCVQCPEGCRQCSSDFSCAECLDTYFLKIQPNDANGNFAVCKRQCEETNTCDPTTTTATVLPLPGLLTLFIWIIIAIALKIFLINGMQVPYSILFMGGLIQFVLVIALIAQTNEKIKTLAVSRLLQQSASLSPLISSLALFAVCLGITYIMNFIFIYIFVKYIKPIIAPIQIDRISNYTVLILSILTTHKFYLLAYSHLFPKPSLQVPSQDYLKPLHIFLSVSYGLDLFLFIAAILLVTSSTQFQNTYMLAIDIIVCLIILWAVWLYVIIRGVPDTYFRTRRKYTVKDNVVTEEGSLHQQNLNQKEASKIKLANYTNQKLQVEQFFNQDISVQAQGNKDKYNIYKNDNMPTEQSNVVKVMPKKSEKIHDQTGNQKEIDDNDIINSKTKRRQNYKSVVNIHPNANSDKKFFKGASIQGNTNSYRNKQQKNADAHISLSYRSNQEKQQQLQKSKMQKQSKKGQFKSEQKMPKQSKLAIKQSGKQQQQEQQVESHQQQEKHQSPTVPRAQTHKSSSTMKINNTMMKKNKKYPTFESELADSNIDQVDLQAIIQTKVVDRSQRKNLDNDVRSEKARGNLTTGGEQVEQISPSWFNIQNQRYDIEDKDE